MSFALPAGRWPGLTVLVAAALLASVWGAVRLAGRVQAAAAKDRRSVMRKASEPS